MQFSYDKKQSTAIIAIVISVIALSAFLYQTKIIFYPVVLFLISLFIIFPLRKKSRFVRRLILLSSLLFLVWLFSDLGYTLLPFFLAFLFSYLLDPVVDKLEAKKIPRWLSALTLDLFFVGLVTLIAVFIFPLIFSQLNDAIKKVSVFFKTISVNFDQRSIYKYFTHLGMDRGTYKSVVQSELLPRMDAILSNILESLMTFLTNFSLIATKLVNIILVPILFFYFLKDFKKIKALLRKILEQKNRKLLFDLQRIDIILRRYIGWQITAALIIATVSSIVYSIFNVPFSIVLGLLCGLLNPIPYVGIIASMLIGILTVIIITPDYSTQYIIVIISTVSALHFINAYFLEPNIVGKRLGAHPLILIASLFVFGGLFGFVGLIIAVPLTAVLVLFFKDWMDKAIKPKEEVM